MASANSKQSRPTKQSSAKKPRKRDIPKHRSFRLTKRRLYHPQPLPSIWALLRKSIGLVKRNKRLFAGILLVYIVSTFVLVQGLSGSSQLTEIKQNIEEALGDETNQLGTSLALYGYLAGSPASSGGEQAPVYQTIITLMITLATIWAVRQLLAGEKPGIREVFYKGMYPIVPFFLVLIVIALQLIPAGIGSFLYATVSQEGLAITAIERILWLVLFVLLSLLSLYMITSSLFALFVATLPDMAPIQSLRSARELVLHRRWRVMFRVVALPVLLVSCSLVVFLPLLIVSPVLAQGLFTVASGIGLIFGTIYLYFLYRALL